MRKGIGRACRIATSVIVALCVTMGLGAWSPHAAHGQDTDGAVAGDDDVFTLAVIPTKVGLASGDRVEALIVMTNTGAAAVTVNSLQVQTPPRIVARPTEPSGPFSLGPGERMTRQFSVTAGYDTGPGDLTVVAQVSGPAPAGSGLTTDRFVVTTVGLEVAAPQGELLVSIVSAPTSLSDGQSNGEMQVLLRNTTSFPMTGVELRPIDSMDLALVAGDRSRCRNPPVEVVACVEDLEPGAVEVVRIGLLVDDSVRAGDQKIGIVATATLGTDAVGRQLSSSAEAEIELTVFGTIAVGPLGSTSLILLPAIVAFVIFLLLSRLVFPRTTWLPAKVDTGDLRWLAALVPVGAFIALVAWLIVGVDVSRETSTTLVVMLYGIGLAFGLIAWCLFASGYQKKVGRKLFKNSDSPRDVLKRLEANNTTLMCLLMKDSATAERVLGRGSDGTVAVSSTIMYDLAGLDDDKRAEFSSAVTAGQSADVLALLEKGGRNRMRPDREAKQTPSLSWASTGVRLLTDEPATGGRASLMEEK